jgi:plastocyanin/nitrite reductase/ring-hydroxylating ferredoxin subunit
MVPYDGSWQAVASSAEVSDTVMHPFQHGSLIGFVRRVDGGPEAVSGICNHRGCQLWFDRQDDRLRCPCHLTSFSPSGQVLSYQLPKAPDPLPHLEVREADGAIEVFAPIEAPDVTGVPISWRGVAQPGSPSVREVCPVMRQRLFRISAALPAVAVGAAAVLLISGCSGSSTSSGSPPSINFGSVTATPGIAGHGTPGRQTAPTPSAPASGPAAPAPQGGTAVAISNFKFDPATLTVPAGTTVTWTNQDEEPHTIAAKDGSFHSSGLDTHGTYSYTFATPGTFDYVCGIHPFMTATVVVTK